MNIEEVINILKTNETKLINCFKNINQLDKYVSYKFLKVMMQNLHSYDQAISGENYFNVNKQPGGVYDCMQINFTIQNIIRLSKTLLINDIIKILGVFWKGEGSYNIIPLSTPSGQNPRYDTLTIRSIFHVIHEHCDDEIKNILDILNDFIHLNFKQVYIVRNKFIAHAELTNINLIESEYEKIGSKILMDACSFITRFINILLESKEYKKILITDDYAYNLIDVIKVIDNEKNITYKKDVVLFKKRK